MLEWVKGFGMLAEIDEMQKRADGALSDAEVAFKKMESTGEMNKETLKELIKHLQRAVSIMQSLERKLP
jgi:hypothetical protein